MSFPTNVQLGDTTSRAVLEENIVNLASKTQCWELSKQQHTVDSLWMVAKSCTTLDG